MLLDALGPSPVTLFPCCELLSLNFLLSFLIDNMLQHFPREKRKYALSLAMAAETPFSMKSGGGICALSSKRKHFNFSNYDLCVRRGLRTQSPLCHLEDSVLILHVQAQDRIALH